MFPSRTLRPARLALVCAWLAVALPSAASAETVYWEAKRLLRDFFPKAQKVSYVQVDLTEEERELLRARLGYTPERKKWTVFVAVSDERVQGYAVFDDEPGQHEPITFAVKLDAQGVIERLELAVYREAHGTEVEDPRFLKQFVGKGWKNALSINEDLVAVGGATISSRALGIGARRVAAVVALLIERRGNLSPHG